MQAFDTLIEKWAPVLNEESAGAITDHHRKAVTAAILENQERAMMEERTAYSGFMTEDASGGANTGSISKWDPVLISLVRRAMPNLMAYDVCGVQPMSGPTGLIFAMKSRYDGGAIANDEALFNEADTGFSGTGTHPAGTGTTTAAGEALGRGGVDVEGNPSGSFQEMGFTIEKATVTAKSRALKAEYSLELAQDLKAIHGLDAETELANILSTEILAEINREVIHTINSQAKQGATTSNVIVPGTFDLETDADGRWSAEKFKGLVVQLDREANAIAKETRRGKGNVVICSSDVATALAASGMLDYTPAMSTGLQVDDTGNTFAGVLNGRTKVYIDPYASSDYITVGYKGTNAYDAGIFYCPYVPLQMVKAVGENDFQPRIGFKTRYGMASNPFVGAAPADGLALAGTNQYYRRFAVANIMGNTPAA